MKKGSLRRYLSRLRKEQLVTMLHDLVMDVTEREGKAVMEHVGDAISREQMKAVIQRRLAERLPRTLGRRSP